MVGATHGSAPIEGSQKKLANGIASEFDLNAYRFEHAGGPFGVVLHVLPASSGFYLIGDDGL
jgi:hypothetical protein